jgi:regulatory protein
MGFTTLSLKGRALRLLSQREHSRAELQRKLAPHVQEGDDLAAVLDELQAKDFISEARVVESTLHRRAGQMGAARIRQELQAKGLGAEAVQQAVDSLQASEFDRAHALWLRKFGAPPGDLRERAKQVRFLTSRGFSGDVIRRVMRAGGQVDHDDADVSP